MSRRIEGTPERQRALPEGMNAYREAAGAPKGPTETHDLKVKAASDRGERRGRETGEEMNEMSQPNRRPVSTLIFLFRVSLVLSVLVLIVTFARALAEIPAAVDDRSAYVVGCFTEAVIAGAFSFFGFSLIVVVIFGLWRWISG